MRNATNRALAVLTAVAALVFAVLVGRTLSKESARPTSAGAHDTDSDSAALAAHPNPTVLDTERAESRRADGASHRLFTIRVLGENGKPVAGAFVRAFRNTDGGRQYALLAESISAVADDSGVARVECDAAAVAGEWSAVAESPDGASCAYAGVPLAADRTTTIDLLPAVTITGTVVGGSRSPESWVRIRMFRPDLGGIQVFSPNRDRSFRLAVPPGTTSLFAFASDSSPSAIWSEELRLGESRHATLELGPLTRDIALTVLGNDGEAVPAGSIVLTSGEASGPLIPRSSELDGRLLVSVRRDGPAMIRYHAWAIRGTTGEWFSLADGGTLGAVEHSRGLEIRLPRAAAGGFRVLNDDGSQLVGYRLFVLGIDPLLRKMGDVEVRSDDAGVAWLRASRACAEGKYEVSDAGGDRLWSGSLSRRGGVVDVLPGRVKSVAVRLVDFAGNPVISSSVWVRALPTEDSNPTRDVDVDPASDRGYESFAGSPALQLHSKLSGGGSAVSIELRCNGVPATRTSWNPTASPNDRIDVRLPNGSGDLRASLRTRRGAIVSGTVTIQTDDATASYVTRTDSEGAVRFAGIVPGRYVVNVTRRGSISRADGGSIQVSPGRTTDVAVSIDN